MKKGGERCRTSLWERIENGKAKKKREISHGYG